MTTFVPLLTRDQIDALPARAREVVEYRKSGLSLNHVQGCPLGCAYCIRHTYGVWDMDQPRALMDDTSAVRALVEHPYFQPHVTPIQVFNRATEPMLPRVKSTCSRCWPTWTGGGCATTCWSSPATGWQRRIASGSTI